MSHSSPRKGARALRVWQSAVDLAVEVCVAAREFPREERYSLGEQMRRAAIGVPSAIAEGYCKPHAPGSTTEYKRYLGIAMGSQGELDTQLVIARRLGCISEEQLQRIEQLLTSTGRMLAKLHASL